MSMITFDLDADVVELAAFVPEAPGAPLREIAFRPDAWLPEEIALVRRLFAEDVSIDDIAVAIGRGRAGVSTKLHDLGLRRNSTRPWNDLDDGELVRRYGIEPAAAIALDLGRACSAIYARAQLLGLSEPSAPVWTAWEDAQVRAGYAAGVPVAQVAQLIGRTLRAVNTYASREGIRHANHPAGWSAEEVSRALDLAHEGHRYLAIIETLVAEGFPRRTKIGFGLTIRKVGYGRGWGRPWTSEEDDLLHAAYRDGASLVPLRQRLGRSQHSIRWRAEYLELQGTHVKKAGWRTEPVWSEQDEQFLRDHYGKMPSPDLAKELRRTLAAMQSRANQLKLRHGYIRDFTAEEDLAIHVAWARGLSLTDLALAMGRDVAVVHKRAKRTGLSFSDPDRPAKPRRLRRAGKTVLTLQDIIALAGAEPLPPGKPFVPGRRGKRLAALPTAEVLLEAPAPAPRRKPTRIRLRATPPIPPTRRRLRLFTKGSSR
ncbi:hypothetical protein [Caulobacter sp. 1776]|uniref:hypothetical protein n=1 Tax=Caulobacter sp. 1776 TaxID=3156420 RepID=UPI003392788A